MLDDALTARIAATKKRLLDGGLLQEVEWGVARDGVPRHTRAGDDRIFAAGRAH